MGGASWRHHSSFPPQQKNIKGWQHLRGVVDLSQELSSEGDGASPGRLLPSNQKMVEPQTEKMRTTPVVAIPFCAMICGQNPSVTLYHVDFLKCFVFISQEKYYQWNANLFFFLFRSFPYCANSSLNKCLLWDEITLFPIKLFSQSETTFGSQNIFDYSIFLFFYVFSVPWTEERCDILSATHVHCISLYLFADLKYMFRHFYHI